MAHKERESKINTLACERNNQNKNISIGIRTRSDARKLYGQELNSSD